MSFPKTVYTSKPRTLPKSLGFSRYSLDFDGADDYVDCGDLSEAEDQVFTYMAWIKTTQTGTDNWVVSEGNSTDDTPIVGIVNQDGVLRLYVRNDANTGEAITGNTTINDGVWHHIAGTADGTTGRIYVDGSFENDGLLPGGTTTLNTCGIGALIRTALCCYVDGAIDGVMIFDRALSAEEVRRNMLNYHNPTKDGLVGWWRFEEGTGLTAHDKSGNGNDGTLKPADNPPTWVEQEKWEMRAEAGL